MNLSNNDKRVVAVLLFALAVIGGCVPNYANIVQFFAPAFANQWWALPYLAGAVYDAAWLAASWAVVTGGAGRSSRAMLVGGVVGAVAVNVRQAWILATATGIGWTVDAVVGHAALPVVGLLAVHGLAHYLRAVPADAREDALFSPAPRVIEAARPPVPAPRRASSTRPRAADPELAAAMDAARAAALDAGLSDRTARRAAADVREAWHANGRS